MSFKQYPVGRGIVNSQVLGYEALGNSPNATELAQLFLEALERRMVLANEILPWGELPEGYTWTQEGPTAPSEAIEGFDPLNLTLTQFHPSTKRYSVKVGDSVQVGPSRFRGRDGFQGIVREIRANPDGSAHSVVVFGGHNRSALMDRVVSPERIVRKITGKKIK